MARTSEDEIMLILNIDVTIDVIDGIIGILLSGSHAFVGYSLAYTGIGPSLINSGTRISKFRKFKFNLKRPSRLCKHSYIHSHIYGYAPDQGKHLKLLSSG